MSSLNLYGDRLVPTSGSHGADISSQRFDDLDRLALKAVLESDGQMPVALDVGCGSGIQGMRMSLLGATVHLFDLVDISDRISAFRAFIPLSSVSFHHGPATMMIKSQKWADGIDIFYSQRTLHYLPFAEAVELLGASASHGRKGMKFFLSASGMRSPLGERYEGKDQPLEARFGHLVSEIADDHQIHERVCLYTEEDITTLAKAAGLQVLKVWSSAFGNVKAVLEG
jgi:hypothetical protein